MFRRVVFVSLLVVLALSLNLLAIPPQYDGPIGWHIESDNSYTPPKSWCEIIREDILNYKDQNFLCFETDSVDLDYVRIEFDEENGTFPIKINDREDLFPLDKDLVIITGPRISGPRALWRSFQEVEDYIDMSNASLELLAAFKEKNTLLVMDDRSGILHYRLNDLDHAPEFFNTEICAEPGMSCKDFRMLEIQKAEEKDAEGEEEGEEASSDSRVQELPSLPI
ncbi:MAG: hypothetical protein ABIA04_12680 [Pseudomonadota bacterium]